MSTLTHAQRFATVRCLFGAVHPAVARVQQEAGELGRGLADVPGLPQRCWRTRDVEGGRTRLPAVLAAGIVNALWSFENLSDAVMGTSQGRMAP